MREVITYVAYDDTEFDTREECESYERHFYNILVSFDEKCEFFDENMNGFCPPYSSSNIEDWIKFFNLAFNKCSYVHRKKNLTDEENRFIREQFGFSISNEDFNNEIGWFYWDEEEIEWVKGEYNPL